VHITNFSLPANAELYFYSPLGEAFGPYAGKGPDGSGEFWTESVFGSEGILQLRFSAPVTPTDLRSVSMAVTEIGHISSRFTDQFMQATAAGFCGNASCVVDASCYNNTPANPAKLAAAKMEWISGAYIYTCTGGLISDNNPSQNNYFLTANHCLSKSATAKNVQFYWRFATSTCNGACPSNTGWPYKTAGAAVRATNRRGDFTLLQLNANPPSGSVFLGWTTTPVANTNGTHLYRISNPNFGPQVYSAHDVSTSAPTCSGWPRGERIYSKDVLGATDGGSSGSPVVNASSQIVGQLSGACGTNPGDPCASAANATVDGAFAYYYSSVQPYLNP
jgi:lysyl endopeptidase